MTTGWMDDRIKVFSPTQVIVQSVGEVDYLIADSTGVNNTAAIGKNKIFTSSLEIKDFKKVWDCAFSLN